MFEFFDESADFGDAEFEATAARLKQRMLDALPGIRAEIEAKKAARTADGQWPVYVLADLDLTRPCLYRHPENGMVVTFSIRSMADAYSACRTNGEALCEHYQVVSIAREDLWPYIEGQPYLLDGRIQDKTEGAVCNE